MDWIQTVILALIQGLSEFLPISSSAHLILPSQVLGWADQGLAFDVAVHVGSLLAVIIYFRDDVRQIISGTLGTFRGQRSESGDLGWRLVIATLPVLVVGFALEPVIEEHLRSARVIAYTTLAGAVLLAIADRWNSQRLDLAQMTWVLALLIGVAQAAALIPGTSRSGATITMALLLGFNRVAAARFSFLMSIPVILLGGLWQGIGLLGAESVAWGKLLLAIVVSGVSAYLCIHYFLRLIQAIGMMPFVIYRLMLGVALLWMLA